jgi:phosphate:Na+ symporter
MDINDIRSRTILMSDKVYEMLELIEKGFMGNKAEPLSQAMRVEDEINDMEKFLTRNILEISKASVNASERARLASVQQTVEMLERMGDEAASLIERIEIKVAEKLLFSDSGVAQYNETYHAMRKSVSMMREFLVKKDNALREKVIDNGFHVKELVERARKEHTERLLKGLCTPMGANMYFDMLDFTGNLARHSSTITKVYDC